jgi:hypothetical protein
MIFRKFKREPKAGRIYVLVAHFDYIRAPEITAALRRDTLDEFIAAEKAREESPYKSITLYALPIPADTSQNEFRLVEYLNDPLAAVAKYGVALQFVEWGEPKNKPRSTEWAEETIGGVRALVKEMEE